MRGVRDRRMVRRSISTSRKVNRLGTMGALLFTWCCLHCDDWGRMEADPLAVKMTVVPGLADYSEEVIADLLARMHDVGLIVRYEANGNQYLEIHQWREIQSWDRVKATPSDIPEPYGTDAIPLRQECRSATALLDPSQVKSSSSQEPPKAPLKGAGAWLISGRVAIEQQRQATARDVVAAYVDQVHAEGTPDTAERSAVKMLKTGFTADDLWAMVCNCARYWATVDPADRYPFAVHNFFGRNQRCKDVR